MRNSAVRVPPRSAVDVLLDVRISLTRPQGLLCEADGNDCERLARFAVDDESIGETRHLCVDHIVRQLHDLEGFLVEEAAAGPMLAVLAVLPLGADA